MCYFQRYAFIPTDSCQFFKPNEDNFVERFKDAEIFIEKKLE